MRMPIDLQPLPLPRGVRDQAVGYGTGGGDEPALVLLAALAVLAALARVARLRRGRSAAA
jgi:hypothetical protein